jgi:hypothetical protein
MLASIKIANANIAREIVTIIKKFCEGALKALFDGVFTFAKRQNLH